MRHHPDPRLDTDDSPEGQVRYVRTARREWLDIALEAGAVSFPIRSFANSLFVELTFATAEDVQALDFLADLIGRESFYWQ